MKSLAYSLFLVISYAQMAAFAPGTGTVALGLALILALYNLLTGKFAITYPKYDAYIIIIFVFFVWFAAGLEALQGQSHEGDRNLFRYALFQLLAVLLTLNLAKSQDGRICIFNTAIAVTIIETSIIALQMSYLYYGIGLEPKSADGTTSALFPTGSQGNPNNSASLLLCMLTICSFHPNFKNNRTIKLILPIVGAAIFFTLSRTILIIYILILIEIVLRNKPQKYKIVLVSALLSLSAMTYFTILSGDTTWENIDSPISRALNRTNSLKDIQGDDSINFRLIAHERLIESIGKLGPGTFSDQNYSKFLQSSDGSLMAANPHSIIVEYSFLYGYTGLISIIFLFIILIYRIIKNQELTLPQRGILVLTLLLVQAVPSSLIATTFFFIIFVYFCRRP